MRLDDYRKSDNIEDVRDTSGGRGSFGGGSPAGFSLPGGGGLGIGGMIVVGLIMFALGLDPRLLLDSSGGMGYEAPQPRTQQAAPPKKRDVGQHDEMATFVSKVLATTEDSWTEIFREGGQRYTKPRLVLFSGSYHSACGAADAAMGPFYCPLDRKVYLDMAFFDELARRFKAPGQFAEAYVIGHEVGHHVQNLIGILPKVQEMQRGMSKTKANALQVRVELQADCFAGVWANRTQRLEAGDIEQAMRAASAIGDDKLQRQAQGYVVPESFTHGSSEQRVRWLTTGYKTGNIESCNTFDARQL